ncbi:MAG TPA: PKD domain-containing protein [Propionicimonas sp.]
MVTATPSAAASCSGGTLTFVAHEDDDLIFINPDIVTDIRAGRCVKTVFLTAGEAGTPYPDALIRENAPEAAYAQMAGVADNWTTTGDDGVPGRNISTRVLVGRSNVSIAFLRLPDGFPSGSGSSTYSGQSLLKLWTGAIASMRTVDNSETYSRSTLISVLTTLMTDVRPSIIRTQDYVSPVTDADHSDHLITGELVLAANSGYTTRHTLMAYEGYATASLPANVSGSDLALKQAALAAASAFDSGADDPWVASMVPKRYVLDTRTTGSSVNRAPVAAAGVDQSVVAGVTVTLSGSGSSDPDGDGLSYVWTQTAGPAVSLSSGSVVSPSFTAPVAGSSLTFSLVVSDGLLSSAADTVVVTVTAAPVNRAPVAAAGVDQSVVTGATVTLSGSGSSDPDGDVLSYAWTQTAGPVVSLSSRSVVSPSFTAPVAGSSLTFSLVVSDGSLSSAADTVVVTVTAAVAANMARVGATATASSQNTADGQTAAKAIDGSPLGYPADYSREWVTARQGAGAWLQLTWSSAVTLERVVLYDRPNLSDQITSGTLTFSNGSSVPVGALNNDGSAVTVSFSSRSVTWVRLTVDSVRAGTSNVGLAEIEAWGYPG